jgi:hypothetical protein
MHNSFKEFLINRNNNSLDGNLLIEEKWTINGFDNYSYYEVKSNKIYFSLNIANINSTLDVFEFKGKILNEGKTIESIISSSNNIFKKSELILNYKNLIP